MIRQALIKRAIRGLQKSRPFTLPAPIGGWNVRDPLEGMPERDAVVLENWFPKASQVELRPGAVNWATGFVNVPKTLMPWNGQSDSKLFAATSIGIYDVTSSGALGASLSTVTDPNFSHVNFTTAGGHFLVAVNGVDKLQLYDGTAWAAIDGTTTPAITGLATTSLESVAVAKRRLWFVQKNSASAWYLPAAAVGGALTELPLGQVFTLGGKLVAIGNWTVDGGDGSDDYTVFMSSEGQVAVYKGTDPASSTTFSLVGTYYIGEPIGRKCFAKYGGDLLVLCQNGLFPLSKALQSSTIDKNIALTAKIDTAFTEAATKYHENPGWSICVFPQGSFVLVNIPVSTTTAEQYVMNSVTGAWCKFTGWNAYDWAVFGTELYFAAANKTAKAWTGVSDFGSNIVGRAQQAYTMCRSPQQKHIKMLRPIVTIDGAASIALAIDIDYAVSGFPASTVAAGSSASLWDASNWDTAVWASDGEVRKDWATVFSFPCYAAALRLQCATNSVTIKWSATVFVAQPCGVL